MMRHKAPKKIGFLSGEDNDFTDRLIEDLSQHHGDHTIIAENVRVGAVPANSAPDYDVILDRISDRVPFYRSYAKWASLCGSLVINDPFRWSVDDKFIDQVVAEQAGVKVPRSVLLPHKEHPPGTESSTFHNLVFPLEWEEIFDMIGFPAFLKPTRGSGWQRVTRLNNTEEFFEAYDSSGRESMLLQESVEAGDFYHCCCIGREDVRIMPYDPTAASPALRYVKPASSPSQTDLGESLRRQALSLCAAIGYEINTVEFSVLDGTPYVLDMFNPVPETDAQIIGLDHCEWMVTTTSRFLLERALRRTS